MSRLKRGMTTDRRPSHRALIGVDDLAAGRKPDPLVLLHVGDGALQDI